ncbi:MAG: elongation factor P [Candidatus Omnitrophota bacterium]
MISTNQFRHGLAFLYEGKIYQIVEFQHIKPGKGGAFVRTKLRNVENGAIVSRTFDPNDRFEPANIMQHKVQYLYHSADSYFFMDTASFEQITIEKDLLGDAVRFLKDGIEILASFCQEKLIGIELPITVEMKVVQTEPGVRGDTARAAYKPATLESGAVVQVPLFIKTDDTIKVDTRTGEYTGRV